VVDKFALAHASPINAQAHFLSGGTTCVPLMGFLLGEVSLVFQTRLTGYSRCSHAEQTWALYSRDYMIQLVAITKTLYFIMLERALR